MAHRVGCIRADRVGPRLSRWPKPIASELKLNRFRFQGSGNEERESHLRSMSPVRVNHLALPLPAAKVHSELLGEPMMRLLPRLHERARSIPPPPWCPDFRARYIQPSPPESRLVPPRDHHQHMWLFGFGRGVPGLGSRFSFSEAVDVRRGGTQEGERHQPPVPGRRNKRRRIDSGELDRDMGCGFALGHRYVENWSSSGDLAQSATPRVDGPEGQGRGYPTQAIRDRQAKAGNSGTGRRSSIVAIEPHHSESVGG